MVTRPTVCKGVSKLEANMNYSVLALKNVSGEILEVNSQFLRGI